MRRPAQQLGPTARNGWAHPYRGLAALAVFYNDGGDPTAPPAPPAGQPPRPGPPPTPAGTFTQDDLDRIAAKEKSQGERAGARKALEEFAAEHGFSNVEDAKEFIAAARKAQDDALSEEQKRQKELADREAQLEAREKAAAARERDAARRAVLVGLGATGDDLEDAAALLRVDDQADDQAVADAAAKLKERRPELFGIKPAADPSPNQIPPAPGGAPAGGPPARQPAAGKPGDRGRAIAAARGHKTAA